MESSRVLVVEDEHLVALDIQLRLERMGHAATVVYSGEAAVDAALHARFDLVLMDIKLQGEIDGIDAAARIRDTLDIPIIYLTAYADNPTLDRARETEPYGYVLKPFQERELKAAIELAVERHDRDRLRFEDQLRCAFLADASAGMTETLDFRNVAMRAVSMLVPRYAEWCAVSLTPNGDLVPAFTYARPEGRRPTNGHNPVALVVDDVARDRKRTVRDVGSRSLIGLPLIARGALLGTLVVLRDLSRASDDAHELALLDDFAQRLGMALDNALLYRHAAHAVRMRDDVLAIVSHDLRSPLATILLQAEALACAPEHEKLGTSIRRAAQRMNRLIGDLLDASAINAGRLSLEVRAHPVAELARDALEMFRSQADAHGVALVEELPEPTARVCCDRDRIIQVLSNLLSNALKFTPRGGNVTLCVAADDERVRIEVIDTGAGIAPEHVPRLFDRFWRGERSGAGAGLGLFISQGIVTAHGATLSVLTEVGVGSRFFFSLARPP